MYDTLQSNRLEEDERNNNTTMNNISHKKGWNLGIVQAYVEPPMITFIKGTYDGKSDKYFVRLKLCRDPMSSTSDLYEFSMYFFDNGKPEEFLLILSNFNMTIEASGTLDMGVKIQ